MLEVYPIEEFTIKGKRVVVIENPVKTHDFKEIKQGVIVDGKAFGVLSIERFAHAPPWRKGERIGLTIEETNYA